MLGRAVWIGISIEIYGKARKVSGNIPQIHCYDIGTSSRDFLTHSSKAKKFSGISPQIPSQIFLIRLLQLFFFILLKRFFLKFLEGFLRKFLKGCTFSWNSIRFFFSFQEAFLGFFKNESILFKGFLCQVHGFLNVQSLENFPTLFRGFKQDFLKRLLPKSIQIFF